MGSRSYWLHLRTSATLEQLRKEQFHEIQQYLAMIAYVAYAHSVVSLVTAYWIHRVQHNKRLRSLVLPRYLLLLLGFIAISFCNISSVCFVVLLSSHAVLGTVVSQAAQSYRWL